MFKITIETEMTTGHKFTDTTKVNSYDNESIEATVFAKAIIRGFKVTEVDNYKITIENNI